MADHQTCKEIKMAISTTSGMYLDSESIFEARRLLITNLPECACHEIENAIEESAEEQLRSCNINERTNTASVEVNSIEAMFRVLYSTLIIRGTPAKVEIYYPKPINPGCEYFVELCGVKKRLTMEIMQTYFENTRRSGGGHVNDILIDYPKRMAHIKFADKHVAWHVIYKFRHKINGVEVLASYPETLPDKVYTPSMQKPPAVPSDPTTLAITPGERLHAPVTSRLPTGALPKPKPKPPHLPPKPINSLVPFGTRNATEIERNSSTESSCQQSNKASPSDDPVQAIDTSLSTNEDCAAKSTDKSTHQLTVPFYSPTNKMTHVIATSYLSEKAICIDTYTPTNPSDTPADKAKHKPTNPFIKPTDKTTGNPRGPFLKLTDTHSHTPTELDLSTKPIDKAAHKPRDPSVKPTATTIQKPTGFSVKPKCLSVTIHKPIEDSFTTPTENNTHKPTGPTGTSKHKITQKPRGAFVKPTDTNTDKPSILSVTHTTKLTHERTGPTAKATDKNTNIQTDPSVKPNYKSTHKSTDFTAKSTDKTILKLTNLSANPQDETTNQLTVPTTDPAGMPEHESTDRDTHKHTVPSAKPTVKTIHTRKPTDQSAQPAHIDTFKPKDLYVKPTDEITDKQTEPMGTHEDKHKHTLSNSAAESAGYSTLQLADISSKPTDIPQRNTTDPASNPIDMSTPKHIERSTKDITLSTAFKPTDMQMNASIHYPIEPITTNELIRTDNVAEPADSVPSDEAPQLAVHEGVLPTSNPSLAMHTSVGEQELGECRRARVSFAMVGWYASSSCWLPDDGLLVSNHDDGRLKRLNAALKVVTDLKLPGKPYAVCSNAARREAAVSLPYERLIQFVSFYGTGLVLSRKIKTDYRCWGVVCRQDELWWVGRENDNILLSGVYITDWTHGKRQGAIVPRNEVGEVIKRIWPWHLAVSDDGDTVYMTCDINKLLVIKRDGTLLREVNPLAWIYCVCLGDANSYFVCGLDGTSGLGAVVHYNREGLVIESKQLRGMEPTSVSFNPNEGTLAVTFIGWEYVAVFHLI